MGISVRDMLTLDIFKNSDILAGEKGLSRVINRVSVFDCPVQVERDRLVLKEGDFFISNFYSFKDDEDYAIYSLEFINSCGCSCFCITNEHVDCFSDKLIKLCDELEFPIITIDYTTSYGDIMTAVMEMILEDQKNLVLDMNISSILYNNLSISELKNTLNYMNPHFEDFISVIYCHSHNYEYTFDRTIISSLNKNKRNFACSYKGGLIIFVTYPKDSNAQTYVDYALSQLKIYVKDYVIGVSNSYVDINLCKNAINQALLCSTSHNTRTNTIVNYSQLGMYSLLLQFKDLDEFKTLYYSIVNPILEYDKCSNSNLMSTLISFVDNDGDYKRVAKLLFQHENTVRYRILKIKSILNLEKSNVEFFEKISIGVKLHKIYSFSNL